MPDVRQATGGRLYSTLGVYGSVKLRDFESMGPAETIAIGQGDERMERKTNIGGTEPNEPATRRAMSKAVVETAKAGQVRRYLGAGWRFARHLLEMVVAMMAGMAVLGVALAVLGEPPGYANLLVRYGLMGAFMAAPMVAWMRHRGHSWSDGLEMTAAMLAPMFALVLPVELGVVGLTGHALMMLSHVAMIGGMVALMVYRWDRYAHGAHDRRA
jgi:hypothetical protein